MIKTVWTKWRKRAFKDGLWSKEAGPTPARRLPARDRMLLNASLLSQQEDRASTNHQKVSAWRADAPERKSYETPARRQLAGKDKIADKSALHFTFLSQAEKSDSEAKNKAPKLVLTFIRRPNASSRRRSLSCPCERDLAMSE